LREARSQGGSRGTPGSSVRTGRHRKTVSMGVGGLTGLWGGMEDEEDGGGQGGMMLHEREPQSPPESAVGTPAGSAGVTPSRGTPGSRSKVRPSPVHTMSELRQMRLEMRLERLSSQRLALEAELNKRPDTPEEERARRAAEAAREEKAAVLAGTSTRGGGGAGGGGSKMKGVVISVVAANMMDLVPRADRDRHGSMAAKSWAEGVQDTPPRPMTPSGEKRRDMSPRKGGSSPHRHGKSRKEHEGHSSPHAFSEKFPGGERRKKHGVFVPPMASDGQTKSTKSLSSVGSSDEDSREEYMRQRQQLRTPSPEPEAAAVPLHRIRNLINSNGSVRRSRRKSRSSISSQASARSGDSHGVAPEQAPMRILNLDRALSGGADLSAPVRGRPRPDRISLH